MDDPDDQCKCMKLVGHLEAVPWTMSPRIYKPSPGYLALGDWVEKPHIWLNYVESSDGLLTDDDVLLSTDTRYWDIHDVQRYFLAEEHCSQVLITYQYPNLRMPTPFGNHLWRANTAMKQPSALFLKGLHKDIEITLKKMNGKAAQVNRMIISDQLVKLDRLDYFKRKMFLKLLLNNISLQENLQLVSFENMRCKRLEGVRLIQQLACFNAETLKYLFLWDFVLPNENPLLINYRYITGVEYWHNGQSTKGLPTLTCSVETTVPINSYSFVDTNPAGTTDIDKNDSEILLDPLTELANSTRRLKSKRQF